MEAQEKTDVEELLEFDEDSAGGLMNSEYIAVPDTATVADAMRVIRENEEQVDTLTTVFLVDDAGRLTGALPVGAPVPRGPDRARQAAGRRGRGGGRPRDGAPQARRRSRSTSTTCMTLPVVDEAGVLVGVITADDVISMLRQD